ncbi:MAG: tRNA (adenosine(37)-N6)-dimethylallyltransferase MiaA [Fulvimarina manganoxydans]|uniref:tRNA (adenosine(37)-N6)-dimethylallyltransferase MiaA n=1 Tax=Fulvimarina manganoxydans TaxID=937218 RepID=UPI002352E3B9|nr:tRNA (adenosine(37)-N6)-dimethylallyltransferase MiaA [Fulvimarina manganoxydans]MCK5930782.1 tRNA (adenosine(37)-N6)-dimethylallyltransferase MiaA [Fulvimarina manganoxydans]
MSVVLIAGPTASGKSHLALRLAERHGGTIINVDSLQVYRDLSILTARPTKEDEAKAPHRLYGTLSVQETMSAGRFLREIAPILDECRETGSLPILCGGTGLYFKALLGLLDEMPEVPGDVRARWRQRLTEEGPAALHETLGRLDPVSAKRLSPADGQRIARALEVSEATGQPFSSFQRRAGRPLVDLKRSMKIVLTPDRALLRQRIAQRFDAMLEAGALAQAAAFHELHGALEGGPAKAIGFKELVDVHRGNLDPAAAREKAITRTRQYAKRQETWFRHQFDESWTRVEDAEKAEFLDVSTTLSPASNAAPDPLPIGGYAGKFD